MDYQPIEHKFKLVLVDTLISELPISNITNNGSGLLSLDDIYATTQYILFINKAPQSILKVPI